MKHRASPLTVLAALILAVASTACDELSAFIPPDTVPLSTSDDPSVKAAGDSSDATDKIREAEAELNMGLETKDISHLDKAVKLRPYDPSYVIYHMVLLWAEGRGGTFEDFGNALGLEVDRQSKILGTPRREAVDRAYTIFRISMLDALAVTKARYARDSMQWQRLNERYCDGIKALQTEGQGLTAQFYSDADCR